MNYKEVQTVCINREFVNRLKQTIIDIETARSPGEYGRNVGKLIGLVDWLAHMKFEEDFNATQLS